MQKFLFTLTLAMLTATRSFALDPNQSPGGNFGLTHWKLQLPTSGGVLTGSPGSVDEVTAAQLEAGFTNSFFFTGSDGAMVFYAPNNGATTGGSTHPRSELREMLTSSTTINWNVYGSNYLAATCIISNVPSDTGKVCIGQMHEPNTKPDGSPSAGNELGMLMFDYNNRRIYSNVDYDGESSTSFSTTFLTGSGVALNTPINYAFTVVNGLMTITVNNVTRSWNLFGGTNSGGQVFTNWDRASGNTVYFKAGSYNQVNNRALPGGATVAFYSLTRFHSAVITNQPASVVSSNGGNAAFFVGALGNANSLRYQWRLNGTNVSANATNATLIVNHINATKTGSYTVVVTDPTPGFTAITSAVATLTIAPPLRFAGASHTGQLLQLQFTGTPGSNYVLQTRTNLNGGTWLNLATNAADAFGFGSFPGLAMTNLPRQFFRFRSP